jgi:hypothetical protein
MGKVINYKKVAEKYCIEICKFKGDSKVCTSCQAKEFGTWLYKNSKGLEAFQSEQFVYVLDGDHDYHIAAIVDLLACEQQKCPHLKYSRETAYHELTAEFSKATPDELTAEEDE